MTSPGKYDLSARPTLRLGSRDEDGRADVEELQRALRRRGSRVTADGIFGVITLAALRIAQRDLGLTVDGVCGPATWAALLGAGPSRVQLAPLPAGLTWGLDVSSAGQPRPLPWQAIREAGAWFAYVRVLHGVDPDSWAVQHAADARAAGLLVGAYGVITTLDPGLAWQCGEDLARRAIELGATDLPLALDLELPPVAVLASYTTTGILSILDAARVFCERAEEIAGRRCAVYTFPAWIETAAQRTGAKGRETIAALADRRPLWLAHYGLDLAGSPACPAAWHEVSIWQASGDDGRLRVDGRAVDLNVTRLSPEELARLGR